jgi:alkylation response protein AidB-like acyl-CoA dehydrogenase
MRFSVSEEAAALRDAAGALLSAQATPAVIRAVWTAGAAASDPRDIWRGLAGLGLVGAIVPETSGGLGLDESALPPVLEQLGYCGLPGPAVETIAVAAPLLAAAGHPALADVLSGSAVVTAQLAAGPAAAPDGRVLVPYAPWADYTLLRAADGLRLYERDELKAEPAQAVDRARPLAWVRPRPDRGTLLAPAPAMEARAAWQRGVLGTAAVLVGLAGRMLSMTADYVKTRHQFGVPVGSFQAVKHKLADVYTSTEFARPVVLAAAWALSGRAALQEPAVDPAMDVSAAKVLASDAAVATARAALQCHGAIGYTTEYDLHLYAKRSWALARSWGSADWHRQQLACALGLVPAGSPQAGYEER